MLNTSMSSTAGLAVVAMLALGTLASAHAQTAARDANTGAWRAPTAAEAAELEALRDKSNLNRGVVTGTLNPKPVRQPDGSDYLESTEGDMNYSVLVVGANGRVARQCVPNATIANRLVRGDTTSFAKNMLERVNDR